MEKTLENKARFFAQYWGQFIGVDIDKTEDTRQMLLSFMVQSTDYIVLKPLSTIIDEDKIYIGLTKGYLEENYPYAENNAPEIFFNLSISDGDYLRSKGYALPWMGLSVEKMIEYGWVKLKSA